MTTRSRPTVATSLFLAHVATIIAEHGGEYVSAKQANDTGAESTATLAWTRLRAGDDVNGKATMLASDALGASISRNFRSEFDRKLYDAAMRGQMEKRHASMTAYVVADFLRARARTVEREVAEAGQRAISNHVANVGERIEITVKVEKTARIDGSFGTSTLHTFSDEHGNLLVWFATTRSLTRGATYTIRGTVKDHGEFRGIAQTKLNRVTVVSEA